MSYKKIFFFLISLLPPLAVAGDFVLMTGENPPFSYTDEKSGKFVGTGTELVEKIFTRAGFTYTILSHPWIRAYNSALKESSTCLFMVEQTEEWQPLFKWVGPFLQVEWVVYGKADAKHKISSIEDLKKLRVGGHKGSPTALFLQEKGIEMDLIPDDVLNPKKLQRDRIDVWVTNNLRGPHLAKKEGLKDLKKLFVIKSVNHFMACNKEVPDSSIGKLNQELKVLKSQGWFKKIVKKYSAQDL